MKINVWSTPTRVFHWLLTIGIVGAFILGETEGSLNMHAAFGYMVAVLLIFRIIWGFVGPEYSRFSDFPLSFRKLKNFFTNMKGEKKKYPGHNPAASWIMIGILLVSIVVTASGILTLASEGQGFFAFLNLNTDPEVFEETHEASVSILVMLVIVHLLGLVIDRMFHGNFGTITSMFTGTKNMNGSNVRLSTLQQLFSWILIVLALSAFGYTAKYQKVEERHHENHERHDSHHDHHEGHEDHDD